MSIASALYAGVSGLNTLGNSMSVIGDNIANVNTIGFKGSRSTFETLLAQNVTGAAGTSQVGRGVTLSAVDPIFSQGSFESTNEPTDMAIGGDGFFMVRSTETGMFYTRAGHFKFDEEGYLVNPSGLRVQGWILEPDDPDPRGAITDIQINATSSAPNATENVDIAVNLDTDSLFVETPGTIESDPSTTSGFVIRNGENDILSFDDGTGAQTVDLVILTAATYFDDDTVYTGSQVANGIEQALNDNSTNGPYVVNYSDANDRFIITNQDAANALTMDATSGTINPTIGLSATTDAVIAATSNYTSDNQISYNIISDQNDSFRIAVDGQNTVSVALDSGQYTVVSLRSELEDKINEALVNAGQSTRVDVRYDPVREVFQILSESRGGTESSIQVQGPASGGANFLPTVNMTDYTLHLGQESNGYTLPGLAESNQENYSRFYINGSNNIFWITTGGANATVNLIADSDLTSGQFYTGEDLAGYVAQALIANTGAASTSDLNVTYDTATSRFNVVNNTGSTLDFLWENTNSTASAVLGYSQNDALDDGENGRSDRAVAFNIVEDQNDEMEILVNGETNQLYNDTLNMINVVIDEGVYSADGLASELETEINLALEDSGLDDRVNVTHDQNAQGRMRIASTRLGSDSNIQVNRDMGITSTDLVGGTLLIDDDTPNIGQGFNVAEPDETSNYSTSLVMYDSLGNQHTVTYYFRKAFTAADNSSTTWEWFAYLPSSETASGEAEAQARGTLTFNQEGTLTGESEVEWLTEQSDGTAGEGFDFGGGAQPQQEVDIDFGLETQTNVSTQYSSPSSTLYQVQDGYGSGFLQDVSVDTDGVVTGNYSNGQVLYLARVALANFTNAWGLSREGGNLWAETRQSGQPLTGTPGTAGLGKIAPNSLEQSNVDLSTEFVNMIIQQRGFQANSRIITTTDDMMAELINLKR